AMTAPAAAPAPAAPAPPPAPAPALVPAPALAVLLAAPPPELAEGPEEAGLGFGADGVGPPPPSLPLSPPAGVLGSLPSRTFFGSGPFCGLLGVGTGRLSACLASCSEPMAWYMSKPTKDRKSTRLNSSHV